MKAILNLTHRCNLACTYCYAGRKFKKDMSFETAEKIVDFIFEITPPTQRASFGFSGGEPLMALDLIKDIVDYIHSKQAITGKSTELSMTTNGTLLSEENLNYIQEANIDICVSIDGLAEIHNRNRKFANGRGSFNTVVKNLKMAINHLDFLQVNTVYDHHSLDSLPSILDFLVDLGVFAIHFNPNIHTFNEIHTYSQLADIYLQLADYYIQSYEQGREIAVNLIDNKIIVLLKGGYSITDRCGMAETEWGFAPSGNIYPCERLVGEDNDLNLCLGNIHTGLDLAKRCQVIDHRGNHNEECTACNLRKYCMNWCACTNYHMTGYTDIASSALCASEKAMLKAAKHVLVSLQDNNLFLDHFMEYLKTA